MLKNRHLIFLFGLLFVSQGFVAVRGAEEEPVKDEDAVVQVYIDGYQ